MYVHTETSRFLCPFFNGNLSYKVSQSKTKQKQNCESVSSIMRSFINDKAGLEVPSVISVLYVETFLVFSLC